LPCFFAWFLGVCRRRAGLAAALGAFVLRRFFSAAVPLCGGNYLSLRSALAAFDQQLGDVEALGTLSATALHAAATH
jgi:hypothetical protein